MFKKLLEMLKNLFRKQSNTTETPKPLPQEAKPLEPPQTTQTEPQATTLPSLPVATPSEAVKAPTSDVIASQSPAPVIDSPVLPPPYVPSSEPPLASWALAHGFPPAELQALLYFASGQPATQSPAVLTNQQVLDAYRHPTSNPAPQVPGQGEQPQSFLTGSLDVESLKKEDFMFIHRHPEVPWPSKLSGSLTRYNQGLNDAFYNGLAAFKESDYNGVLRQFIK